MLSLIPSRFTRFAQAVPAAPAWHGPRTAGWYRNDLDGLRGIAIALVAAFHVWFGRVSGGVDVFLALSGFFFGGKLLRTALNPSASLSPLPEVVRLVRRLLPALVVVLAAAAVLTILVQPETRWEAFADQSLASLGYYQNWELAHTASSYLSAAETVSPLQHIWSMSVQGQFYIAFLALVLLYAFLFRRVLGKSLRISLVLLLSGLTISSFIFAVFDHQANQATAYYNSFGRAWELLLGALVGALVPYVRWPMWLRNVVATVALAAILACGALIDGVHQFPGPLALVPVGATVLLILAAANRQSDPRTRDRMPAPNRLLASRPFVALGAMAYSLYLWHWPLLIFWLAYSGDAHAGLVDGAGVLLVSGVLAHLTTRYVENPLRLRTPATLTPATLTPTTPTPTTPTPTTPTPAIPTPTTPTPTTPTPATPTPATPTPATPTPATPTPATPRPASRLPLALRIGRPAVALGPAVVLLAVALTVTSFAWRDHVEVQRANGKELSGLPARDYPGARALINHAVVPKLPMRPTVLEAKSDLPETTIDGCISDFGDDSIRNCTYGDKAATRTIALAGGSHAEHWITALDLLGRFHHFKVVTYLKMGCPLSTEQLPLIVGDNMPYPQCHEWVQKVMAKLVNDHPDYVFTNSTRPRDAVPGDMMPSSYLGIWDALSRNNIAVLGMRDTPWMSHNGAPFQPADCLAGGGNPVSCGVKRSDVLDGRNPTLDYVDQFPLLKPLDMTEAVCRRDICRAVEGNVLLYHDSHHLSATYVRTMTTELGRQLAAATGWW
jgi:peptidoglycan/LPS O-acetylase OafA/YrhL